MSVDAVILLFLLILTPLATGAALLLWIWAKLRRRAKILTTPRPLFVERRWVVLTSATIFLLYLLAYFWASLIEPYQVETTVTEIKVSEPVLGHDRFRIVHISDLHIEGETSRERQVVEAVLEAHPDLIVLTGDYLNDRHHAHVLRSLLESMEAPYGVYGVPGNWDSKFEIDDVFRTVAAKKGLSGLGPRYLLDDFQFIKEGDRKLLIVGQDVRYHRSLSEILKGSSEDAFVIFLHHLPDAMEQIRRLPKNRKVGLFLCGHTHGGQVRLPAWGAVFTRSPLYRKYEMGYYKIGDTHMYVNRGVGMQGGLAPRVRFHCRPEVAVIDLVYK